MDIIIRFNTAFYDNGQIVNEKELIINRYLKGYFVDTRCKQGNSVQLR